VKKTTATFESRDITACLAVLGERKKECEKIERYLLPGPACCRYVHEIRKKVMMVKQTKEMS
jgi:hypothetical protein